MPDMTMCTNTACPKRTKCFRYLAIPDERQSWARFEAKDCAYFMALAKGDRLVSGKA
jgi:hypothetical protein